MNIVTIPHFIHRYKTVWVIKKIRVCTGTPPGGGGDGETEVEDYRYDYWYDQTTTKGTVKDGSFYGFAYTMFESSKNTGTYGAMTRTPECGNVYAPLVPGRKIYTCQDQYGNWSYFYVTADWKGGAKSKTYFTFAYYTPQYE